MLFAYVGNRMARIGTVVGHGCGATHDTIGGGRRGDGQRVFTSANGKVLSGTAGAVAVGTSGIQYG